MVHGNSQISPMYNNPVVYTTGLPVVQGYLLMLLGIIDLGMAETFFRRQVLNESWDELAAEEMGDMNSEMAEMGDMAEMGAREKILWEFMIVFVFGLVIAFIFRKLDARDRTTSTTSTWRDEVFNTSDPGLQSAA